MAVRAGVGSALFFLAAPGTVAGLVPFLLTDWDTHNWYAATIPARTAGVLLMAAGGAALVDCFLRFVREGRGTPAPIAPTERLVVRGLYRYVRNPMYVSVVALIVGQGLLLGRFVLLGYAAVMWTVFHLAVVVYEEPTLRRTFGDSYEAYRAAVPRWWPRFT